MIKKFIIVHNSFEILLPPGKFPRFPKILNIKVFTKFDFVDHDHGNVDSGNDDDCGGGEEIDDKDYNFHF